MNTTQLQTETPVRVGPVLVLDSPARARDIYGPAISRIGLAVQHQSNPTPESVLALDPSVILLSSEWTHEWRLVAAAARREGIPVVYVMDGVIEWSYLWNNLSFIRPWGTMLQPMIASDLCVIGRHPARILASMGLADRTHLVGMPRFDNMSRQRVITAGRRPRILVATARTAGHDVEQQVLARRALRDLHDWAATQPALEIVWRIAADLAEDIGVEADINGMFEDVLASCDALISFTSTCLLEGMHKGIPVAQIDYRSAPVYVATAWEIRCAEHIPAVVQELLHPPVNKLAWQDACFADELESGSASERLATVLREVVARPRIPEPGLSFDDAETSAGNELQQRPVPVSVPGRLDYRQVHSELSCFAIGAKPVLQYELAAAHHQLRHTRNEKGFLQRDCIELVEAVTGDDIDTMRTYAFIDQLATAGQNGHSREEMVAINGRPVRSLVTQTPAELTFCVPTGRAGQLSLALSLHPDTWDNPHAGFCSLRLLCDGKKVFDAKLDFRNSLADRKWWWVPQEIPASSAGQHTFVIQVTGPDGAAAVWRSPLFRWREAEALTNRSFRPRALKGADFYVPGRSVA